MSWRLNQLLIPIHRFIWNFFRLENEHLNNCGQFRVVRDISIAPVDMTDQEEILTMMDFKDGAQQVDRAFLVVLNLGEKWYFPSG